MVTAVIVQARIGSSRLPGKVLEPLGARSALVRCLERCARITAADEVICAVPDTPENDPVAREARSAGFRATRGGEHDVLSRYADAARACGAETVVRITSDCPFVDPVIVDQTIALFHASAADYASNSLPARFPHGLDCEVFSAKRLFEAERSARSAAEREHVTVWIQNNPAVRRAGLIGPGGGVERLRWTLDQPEDLQFCQGVFAHLGEAAADASAGVIAKLCFAEPALPAINARWHDAARLDPSRRADVQLGPVELPE